MGRWKRGPAQLLALGWLLAGNDVLWYLIFYQIWVSFYWGTLWRLLYLLDSLHSRHSSIKRVISCLYCSTLRRPYNPINSPFKIPSNCIVFIRFLLHAKTWQFSWGRYVVFSFIKQSFVTGPVLKSAYLIIPLIHLLTRHRISLIKFLTRYFGIPFVIVFVLLLFRGHFLCKSVATLCFT
jgi:hypothetical protein